MTRHFARFALVSSLLLCISAAALWVRGYFAGDILSWARETLHGQRFEYRTAGAFSTHGGLWITYGYYRRDLSAAEAASRQPRRSNIGLSRFDDYPGYPRPLGDTPITLANLLGFRLGSNGGVDAIQHTTNSTSGIVIPDWFLVLVFAVPAVWLLWRRPRPRPNRCRVCGYDLRATPDRCPECGTAVIATAPAT